MFLFYFLILPLLTVKTFSLLFLLTQFTLAGVCSKILYVHANFTYSHNYDFTIAKITSDIYIHIDYCILTKG